MNDFDETGIDPDDEWLTELSEGQRREAREIKMMIDRLSGFGIPLSYAFRGYDRRHLLEVANVKCYGYGPKVHAFLSGALATAAAYEWAKASRPSGDGAATS